VAGALREAAAALRPVRTGAGTMRLPGLNANRRSPERAVDQDLTVLRIDDERGVPYGIVFHFTAHGTIMTPEVMLVSGGWPGVAQRTVQQYMGHGVTALFVNGAEGDVEPVIPGGASPWEQAENYGREVGLAAGRLAEGISTLPVRKFRVARRWVDLPACQVAPDFAKIAGEEYGVSEEHVQQLMQSLLPNRAPLYSLRIGDFQVVTFPGEPTNAIGAAVKTAMAEAGVANPCVAPLTNEYVGYILTRDEYHESGYEVTTSFYGDGLGELLRDNALVLATHTSGGSAGGATQ
jgi:hypothetical protein